MALRLVIAEKPSVAGSIAALAARHFVDKAENQLPLAPRVASIDYLGNVGAVHKLF